MTWEYWVLSCLVDFHFSIIFWVSFLKWYIVIVENRKTVEKHKVKMFKSCPESHSLCYLCKNNIWTDRKKWIYSVCTCCIINIFLFLLFIYFIYRVFIDDCGSWLLYTFKMFLRSFINKSNTETIYSLISSDASILLGFPQHPVSQF